MCIHIKAFTNMFRSPYSNLWISISNNVCPYSANYTSVVNKTCILFSYCVTKNWSGIVLNDQLRFIYGWMTSLNYMVIYSVKLNGKLRCAQLEYSNNVYLFNSNCSALNLNQELKKLYFLIISSHMNWIGLNFTFHFLVVILLLLSVFNH